MLDFFFDYPGYRLDDALRKKAADFIGSESLSERYFSLNSLFNTKQKDLLYTTDFKEELGNNDTEEISILKELLDNPDNVSIHNKLIRAEMKYWLPNYHLVKEDKIAMSHSLEQRYPFLDHKLVEFVAKLPGENKNRNGVTKDILRKAFNKSLPDEIINRKKGPILVPIDKCFEASFRTAANDYLSEHRINEAGYYNYPEIKRLLKNLDKNPFMFQRQIFGLLTLEIWKEVFTEI
jgi:asparagine synthase (glutamine-hydrolysing)